MPPLVVLLCLCLLVLSAPPAADAHAPKPDEGAVEGEVEPQVLRKAAPWASTERPLFAAPGAVPILEIYHVSGCPFSTNPRRGTFGCFGSDVTRPAATASKKAKGKQLLTIRGAGFPADLSNVLIQLEEHVPHPLPDDATVWPAHTDEGESAGGSSSSGSKRFVVDRLILPCRDIKASPTFPNQLLTCTITNPLLLKKKAAERRRRILEAAETTPQGESDVPLTENDELLELWEDIEPSDFPMFFDLRMVVLPVAASAGAEGVALAGATLRGAVQLAPKQPVYLKQLMKQVNQLVYGDTDEMEEEEERDGEEVDEHPLESLFASAMRETTDGSDAGHAHAANREKSAMPLSEEWLRIGIGGLEPELRTLFRRVLLTRLPSLTNVVHDLRIQHVRGVLLHGPPGTGKTLIARTIAKLLGPSTTIKIINGPEVLSKYVGESEKNMRLVFEQADMELATLKDGAGLHVVVIDEMDALLKKRGGKDESSAKASYDGITAQLLSIMDGMDAARSNLLIIGLTNRLSSIDAALLRPGRFEVVIHVPLPDAHGRLQVLYIHTEKLRKHHYLGADIDLADLADLMAGFSGADIAGTVRAAISYAMERYRQEMRATWRAAAANETEGREAANVTAAHSPLEGVEVKLQRHIAGHIFDDDAFDNDADDSTVNGHSVNHTQGAAGVAADGNGNADDDLPPFLVDTSDFLRAIEEVKETMEVELGSGGHFLDSGTRPLVDYDGTVLASLDRVTDLASRLHHSKVTHSAIVSVYGVPGSGKTHFARNASKEAGFEMVRVVSGESMHDLNTEERIEQITDAFAQAAASTSSCIIIDSIEEVCGTVYRDDSLVPFLISVIRKHLLSSKEVQNSGFSEVLPHQHPTSSMHGAASRRRTCKRMVIVTTSKKEYQFQLGSLTYDAQVVLRPIHRSGLRTLLEQVGLATPMGSTADGKSQVGVPASVLRSYPAVIAFRHFIKLTDMALLETAGPAAAADGALGSSNGLPHRHVQLPSDEVARQDFYRTFSFAVQEVAAEMGLSDPHDDGGFA